MVTCIGMSLIYYVGAPVNGSGRSLLYDIGAMVNGTGLSLLYDLGATISSIGMSLPYDRPCHVNCRLVGNNDGHTRGRGPCFFQFFFKLSPLYQHCCILAGGCLH